MALLVDGNINTIDELLVMDHNILALAGIEGVNLTHKLTFAQQIVEQDVLVLINKLGQRWRLEQIVVTPLLKSYHALRTLEKIYQDVYLSQGLERYQRAWEQYRSEAQLTWRNISHGGLGVCQDPLGRPQPPSVSLESGPGPSGSLEVCMCWIDQRGQESAMSAGTLLLNPAGESVSVEHGPAPAGAASWAVYMALTPEEPRRQTSALPLGERWTTPSSSLVDFGRPPAGQKADVVVETRPLLIRG